MKTSLKKLPFYGDLIVYKFKFNRRTFVIGLALPDDVDVHYPCYYLYYYDRKSPGCWHQVVGHRDFSYIYNYFEKHFMYPF